MLDRNILCCVKKILRSIIMDYILSCCSTVDLPLENLKARGVFVKNYKFTISDKMFDDDGGQSISYKEFYQAMRDGAVTKTSQINVEEFTEYFRELLQKYDCDVLHLSMSSGISGTFNSARLAAESLKEEFPERRVVVLDSLCISGGYGFLVEWLCDLKENGYTFDELIKFADENKLRIHHWFYSTDLTFYVKGGRISKVSGLIGSILKICPVMNVNFEGKLIPRIKTLGKKKALFTAIERMAALADGGVDYSGRCIINHSDCLEDALLLKNAVEERFPLLKDKIEMTDIGTTIGCHSGPGTVAVYFLGKTRDD